MNKKGERFLKEVTNHIKSKEAKDLVAMELDFHLKQAKNMWMDKGLSEEVAEDKAVEQMGSPVKLGEELNKLYKPKVDWFLIGLLVAAMGLGFLPIITFGHADLFMNKVIFVILGVVTAMGMMLLDYRRLEKLGWMFYTIGVLILLMIKCFPTDYVIGEAIIKIGPIKIDCLMTMPFFFLAWASFFNNSRLKFMHLLILYVFSLYLFSTTSILLPIFIYITMVFVMLWWSKLGKNTAWLITILPILPFIVRDLFSWSAVKEYRIARILGFINPAHDQWDLRLQEAMSSAGWFGTYGNIKSIRAAHTDFVFASLTYYYGYVLALVLVVILSLFAVRIMNIAYKINDGYGKLLLVGGVTLFVIHFICNVGMTLGILPRVSISLPFISYGLIPTLFHAFIMGIVLSVYRRKDIPFRMRKTP
ncbi:MULTISPECIES: FtsW/RodA/SpoVE family cell cycle protein [Bacillus]|uniref:FtsW/RodA/SpoVE family cell cycle protein n=1 Tax=Bacillus cereus TaxID=1396 RepID=A0A9W7Q5R3_BACCE|nr:MULTISPECIES: FtsW/RodA/SpoVE family cell cycle protein [Bacillus]AXR15614.1 FtsW/RodA/SpoVE family cell cycle protein [Bacillus sp. CR71]AXR21348.1 FtsW/RodA/SpoVE family cell cycle protein [Bacillus sp. E25]KAA6467546.1 FtsW/RodA/SpoVE family cell cycle protein [Bacillus cereus]KAB2419773.1 FtsW/RodA/SpoVE family cell cycle protein [Bacillus cereus]KAB2455409.1 FtsW/RodA/SpoVE family cell cycle protein [Bacillus cereus]